MKGNWHFIALAACVAILTNAINQYLFFILFIVWLIYLFARLKHHTLPLVLTFASLLFFTVYIPSSNSESKIVPHVEGSQTLIGNISGAVSITPAKLEFQFYDPTVEQTFQIVHFFEEASNVSSYHFSSIKHGSSCEIKGEITRPKSSRNPGQFDFQHYLAKQGITYQMIVKSPHEIKCEGSSILEPIFSLRVKMIEYTNMRLSPDTTAWLNALIFGDTSLLEDDLIELFRRWSLSHLLAISGLHVGLIIGVIYFLLIKLSVLTKEKAQWFMIIFLPVYALIAGGEPSVWRASLMAVVLILLNKVNIKLNATDVISVVFIALIIMNPYIVYHIGFQFSFLVSLGLILSKRWFTLTQSSVYRILQISFISQMIILPLQLTYFYTFKPLSIILNVIVVPYFSFFVIPYLLLLFFLSPLPIASLFDQLFSFIHKGFLSMTYIIDQYFHYPLVIGEIPMVIALLYYVVFIIWMCFLEGDRLSSSIKYGVIMTCLIIYCAIRPYLSPYGTVTMLDIGQGDAIVIELPYRKGIIFVDVGANFSFTDLKPTNRVYQRIIKPYLHSRGINKIDAIILSHEDSDHVGSLPFIVKDMKVGSVVFSDLYQLDHEMERLILDKGINMIRTSYNEKIILNGKEFKVLGPIKDQADPNENSLVLLTTIGGKTWLFTGDIGVSTEKQLLQTYPKLNVDVLKVAHHGSQTSSSEAFIEHIRPQYGLISVGEHNMYGHPANEVIQVLEDKDIVILRTDMHGAIQYRYQKNNGTFLIYRP